MRRRRAHRVQGIAFRDFQGGHSPRDLRLCQRSASQRRTGASAGRSSRRRIACRPDRDRPNADPARRHEDRRQHLAATDALGRKAGTGWRGCTRGDGASVGLASGSVQGRDLHPNRFATRNGDGARRTHPEREAQVRRPPVRLAPGSQCRRDGPRHGPFRERVSAGSVLAGGLGGQPAYPNGTAGRHQHGCVGRRSSSHSCRLAQHRQASTGLHSRLLCSVSFFGSTATSLRTK